MPAEKELDGTAQAPEDDKIEEMTDEEKELLKRAEEDPDNLDDVSKEDLAAALLKVNKTNGTLYARAKKAEGNELVDGKWVKKQKPVEKPVETKQPIKQEEQTDVVTIDTLDERLLQDKGMTEEDIAYLKFIQAGEKASGRKVSLVQAQQHELFKAHIAQKEAKDKSDKAQIRSKGGSGFHGEKPKTPEERETARKAAAQRLLNQ